MEIYDLFGESKRVGGKFPAQAQIKLIFNVTTHVPYILAFKSIKNLKLVLYVKIYDICFMLPITF